MAARPDSSKLVPRPRLVRFALVMLGLLAQGLLFTVAAPALPDLAAHLGPGADGQFLASTAAMASAGLGLAAGGWLSAPILKRLTFGPFFIVSLIAMAVGGSAPALLDQSAWIFVARTLAGIATACLTTGCLALIPQLYEAEARAGIVGFQQAFGGGTAAVMAIVAGLLVSWAGWRAPFWLFAPPFLAALLLVRWLPARGVSAEQPSRAQRQADFRAALAFWPIYGLALLTNVLFFIIAIQMPYALHLAGSSDAITISFAITAGTLAMVAACTSYGFLAARWNHTRLLQIAGAVFVVALTILAFIHAVPVALFAAGLVGLAGGLATSCVHDLGMRKSVAAGPMLLGLMVTASSLGAFVNPMLFGALTAAAGLPGALLIVAAALAIGVAASLVGLPTGKPAQPGG